MLDYLKIIFLILFLTKIAAEISSKGTSRISDAQSGDDASMPRFAEPIPNVTVSVGRDALLACVVENLKIFKVAWVRVDTQTILSIHHNVITQNPRISLTYNDHRSWYLHIKEVEESDRGWYMCQINTDPMRSRKGYLQVVVPPMIIESMTSNDMVVREGTNVTLMCKARGYPEPYVMWRREDGEEMSIGGETVNVVDGEILHITKVSRLHMAAYLCVASNGVPPSISKRVHLRVQFPPMLSIANQLEGAYVGQEVILECETEAYPASINYWTTERGDMIISDTSRAGDKFETTSLTRGYHKFMKLKIRNVSSNDFGSYRCVAKNSLGETDGIIKLDEILAPTTAVMSEITMYNRSFGKRPHKKFDLNSIFDYGLEEWKDGGDTNQPPSVRHPPGAFHNTATSGSTKLSSFLFLLISSVKEYIMNTVKILIARILIIIQWLNCPLTYLKSTLSSYLSLLSQEMKFSTENTITKITKISTTINLDEHSQKNKNININEFYYKIRSYFIITFENYLYFKYFGFNNNNNNNNKDNNDDVKLWHFENINQNTSPQENCNIMKLEFNNNYESIKIYLIQTIITKFIIINRLILALVLMTVIIIIKFLFKIIRINYYSGTKTKNVKFLSLLKTKYQLMYKNNCIFLKKIILYINLKTR